jgi:hypothetical protein
MCEQWIRTQNRDGDKRMSEGFFTIELGSYGFMLDTALCYIAISWKLIALSVVSAIIYKVIKRKRVK